MSREPKNKTEQRCATLKTPNVQAECETRRPKFRNIQKLNALLAKITGEPQASNGSASGLAKGGKTKGLSWEPRESLTESIEKLAKEQIARELGAKQLDIYIVERRWGWVVAPGALPGRPIFKGSIGAGRAGEQTSIFQMD